MIITISPEYIPFRGHAVLISGALGATMLGALTALQLDLVLAVGERLLHPVGQAVLLKTTVTASLTGLLCWVVCALVTRAISRAALRPYDALADHFERMADGNIDSSVNLRGRVPGARRLARTVVLFQQRALESKRSEAALQARYDRLDQEHVGERRVILGMLMNMPLDAAAPVSGQRPAVGIAPVGLHSSLAEIEGETATQSGRYDSLYKDTKERGLLMDMLMNRRLNLPVGLLPLTDRAPAEFDIPEPRSDAADDAFGPLHPPFEPPTQAATRYV